MLVWEVASRSCLSLTVIVKEERKEDPVLLNLPQPNHKRGNSASEILWVHFPLGKDTWAPVSSTSCYTYHWEKSIKHPGTHHELTEKGHLGFYKKKGKIYGKMSYCQLELLKTPPLPPHLRKKEVHGNFVLITLCPKLKAGYARVHHIFWTEKSLMSISSSCSNTKFPCAVSPGKKGWICNTAASHLARWIGCHHTNLLLSFNIFSTKSNHSFIAQHGSSLEKWKYIFFKNQMSKDFQERNQQFRL